MKDCKHGQVRENKRYLTLGSTKRGKPCLWDPVKESGMLLVTGPTGSGKTCLLAMLATQTLTNGGRVFYTSLAKDSDFPDAVLRHCDSVTGMGDFAGVVDHLERLCDELEQRAALVVEHHTDSIYKIDESMVSAGEQHLIAPVAVIIDDFDYLFQWWHTHPEEYARKLDVYRLMGSLAALVGRGCLLGIRLAMAAQHFTIDDMVSVPLSVMPCGSASKCRHFFRHAGTRTTSPAMPNSQASSSSPVSTANNWRIRSPASHKNHGRTQVANATCGSPAIVTTCMFSSR